jgi:hypothetical protein
VTVTDGQRRLFQLVGFIVAIPVVVIALWFGYGSYVDYRYVSPWQKVDHGDTEDRVIALLGRPHRITTERIKKVGWESQHNIDWYDGECVKQFRYIPFSITGEEYDIGFDSSGRAVFKVHVTSP